MLRERYNGSYNGGENARPGNFCPPARTFRNSYYSARRKTRVSAAYKPGIVVSGLSHYTSAFLQEVYLLITHCVSLLVSFRRLQRYSAENGGARSRIKGRAELTRLIATPTANESFPSLVSHK